MANFWPLIKGLKLALIKGLFQHLINGQPLSKGLFLAPVLGNLSGQDKLSIPFLAYYTKNGRFTASSDLEIIEPAV